ncbi:MAG: hypothetical protein ACLGIR_13945 [Actinomycetes bacterium]
MEEIEDCTVCGLELETEKGEAFLDDEGDIYCNDHYPARDLLV